MNFTGKISAFGENITEFCINHIESAHDTDHRMINKITNDVH